MFRVRVGTFKTRREAETVAARLQKEEQFKPLGHPLTASRPIAFGCAALSGLLLVFSFPNSVR